MTAFRLVHGISFVLAGMSVGFIILPLFVLNHNDDKNGAFVFGALCAGGTAWIAFLLSQVTP